MKPGNDKPPAAPLGGTEPAPLRRGRWRGLLLTLLGGLALVAGLYAAAGFYGVPWLVDRWFAQYRDTGAARTATHESIRFNPFTLRGEITRLELGDAELGTELAALRLDIAFSPGSALERRPVVDAVTIEGLRVAAPSVAELAALARDLHAGLPARSAIDRLAISGATILAGTGAGRRTGLSDLDLALTGFDGAGSADAAFEMAAQLPGAGRLEADGTVTTNLEDAQGRLRLEGLDIGSFADRLGGIVAGSAPEGSVDLSSSFRASRLLGKPVLELPDASLAAAAIALRPNPGLRVAVSSVAAGGDLTLTTTDDGADLTGRFDSDGLRLEVTDARIAPAQSFVLEDTAVVTGFDSGNDALSLSLGGRLRGGGDVSLTMRGPLAATGTRRVAFQAERLPAATLSAYARASLEQGLGGGEADLDLSFTRTGSRTEGSLDVTTRSLELTPPAARPRPPQRPRAADRPSPAGSDARLELAVALLEDARGEITLDLPFASNGGSVGEAVTAALRARVAAVTESPFSALALDADDSASAGSAIPFLPGDAALTDQANAAVAELAAALDSRPRLGIRVHGAYDAGADRTALARQQIELHIRLATAGPTAPGEAEPIDLDSPRVRDVLDEFGGERLGQPRIAEMRARYECEGPLAAVCERTYYEAVFDALVANEEIAPTALGRLGRFRALSVTNALTRRGVAENRIELVTDGESVETPFGIGLPIELIARDTARE